MLEAMFTEVLIGGPSVSYNLKKIIYENDDDGDDDNESLFIMPNHGQMYKFISCCFMITFVPGATLSIIISYSLGTFTSESLS